MKRIVCWAAAFLLCSLGLAVVAPSGRAATTAAYFHAVKPCRVFDTRTATPGCVGSTPVTTAAVAGTHHVSVPLAGVGGVPAGATAVVLNVTAVGATAATFVTAYPDGVARPGVSSLNVTPGSVVANQVTIRLINGRVDFYNNAGSIDLLADLAGYFAPGSGAGYTAIEPCRAFDTRVSSGGGCAGAPGLAIAKVAAGHTLRVPIRGVAGVSSTATAVTLNLTAANATAATFVSVYPTGATRPVVSNVNAAGPLPIPNLVTVPIGSDGSITLYNGYGSVDLIGDLSGYFAPGAGAAFMPLTPCRINDTRIDNGSCSPAEPYKGQGRLSAGSGIVLRVPGVGGVPTWANGRGATAAVLNVTAVGASNPTFICVVPGSASALPKVSNLNLYSADPVANAVVVTIPPGVPDADLNSNGLIVLYNNAGGIDLISDLVGYFYTV